MGWPQFVVVLWAALSVWLCWQHRAGTKADGVLGTYSGLAAVISVVIMIVVVHAGGFFVWSALGIAQIVFLTYMTFNLYNVIMRDGQPRLVNLPVNILNAVVLLTILAGGGFFHQVPNLLPQ